MAVPTCSGDALYIAWEFENTRGNSPQKMCDLLTRGEERHLYKLRSWVVLDGVVKALVTPVAAAKEIAEAISGNRAVMIVSRRIQTERACAVVARRIETAPVSLGLAARPEQWPLSSAASE
jgi:hypothetical protein